MEKFEPRLVEPIIDWGRDRSSVQRVWFRTVKEDPADIALAIPGIRYARWFEGEKYARGYFHVESTTTFGSLKRLLQAYDLEIRPMEVQWCTANDHLYALSLELFPGVPPLIWECGDAPERPRFDRPKPTCFPKALV